MSNCVFCKIAAHRFDDPELTVFEDDHVFVRINLSQKPGNHGHVLVIPKQHIPSIYELPQEIDAPLMSALRLMARVLKEALSADGVHIRQNNEPASGQDVFHLHFHVIPRYHGDGFETKKYERLELSTRKELAKKLKPAIQKERKRA
jgi:histidine triad (HIT) family protein